MQFRLKQEHVRASGGDCGRHAACVACVEPLAGLLCADAADVGVAEWQRVAMLLSELVALAPDPMAVVGALHRPDEAGVPLFFSVLGAPSSVFGAAVRTEPGEWTSVDAVTLACHAQLMMWIFMFGGDRITADIETTGLVWVSAFLKYPILTSVAEPPTRFLPMALLCLELVRDAAQPEAVRAGSWWFMGMTCEGYQGRPVATALVEAGVLNDAVAVLKSYSPAELISNKNLTASCALAAMKDLAESAEQDVAHALLDAGVVEISIGMLRAYQERPGDASVAGCWYGMLFGLEVCLLGASDLARRGFVEKLRAQAAETFQFVLDNPLVQWSPFQLESGVQAAKIAALVWGSLDEDMDGITLKPEHLDALLGDLDHRKPSWHEVTDTHGQHILNLCISDKHKEILISNENFISVLVDCLFVDPEHPLKEDPKTDFEHIKGPVQRDFAEAVQQLAVWKPGCEALLRHDTVRDGAAPSVVEALREVASNGWTEEARTCAAGALMALDPTHLEGHRESTEKAKGHDQLHVMVSYQWDAQPCVKIFSKFTEKIYWKNMEKYTENFQYIFPDNFSV